MQHFCFRTPEMVQEMDCFLRTSVGMKSLFDVGAFHGVFALAFAAQNRSARVCALEPSEKPFNALVTNCKLNPALSVTPIMAAAGSDNGVLKMTFEWEHLVAIEHSVSYDGAPPVEVPVYRLDELARREGFWPDVIKIDVEGFENEVLAGAKECLRNCQVVHLEVHPMPLSKRGANAADLLRDLSRLGFEVILPSGKTWDPALRSVPKETFRVALIRSKTAADS